MSAEYQTINERRRAKRRGVSVDFFVPDVPKPDFRAYGLGVFWGGVPVLLWVLLITIVS